MRELNRQVRLLGGKWVSYGSLTFAECGRRFGLELPEGEHRVEYRCMSDPGVVWPDVLEVKKVCEPRLTRGLGNA